jgi:predicted choloylglycine hydrolase
MLAYQKLFKAIAEDTPGDKWLANYNLLQAGYRQWFLKEGELNRPNYLECKNALTEHLPELVPLWNKLLKLTQADDIAARMLSLYCPTPYVTGCAQAVWTRYNPILVRNYDYNPALSEGILLKSKWHDTQVIAMTDCLWGVLDGMNEHGLCVSLTFAGKNEVTAGFGIPLILRYILEFCKNIEQALDILLKVPTHMAYNITLLDADFNYKTVELSALAKPKVTNIPLATNHQGLTELTNYSIFSKSLERKKQLLQKLQDPLVNIEAFINAFEYEPLFNANYANNFGTLYTGVYNPALRAMEYRWPHYLRMYQSFEYFEEQEWLITY